MSSRPLCSYIRFDLCQSHSESNVGAVERKALIVSLKKLQSTKGAANLALELARVLLALLFVTSQICLGVWLVRND